MMPPTPSHTPILEHFRTRDSYIVVTNLSIGGAYHIGVPFELVCFFFGMSPKAHLDEWPIEIFLHNKNLAH